MVSEILQEINFSEEANAEFVFAEFVVFSGKDLLDFARVSAELGLSPDACVCKGERFQQQKILENGAVKIDRGECENDTWYISTIDKVQSKRIGDHIAFLLSILTPKRREIQELICNSGAEKICIFLYWVSKDDWVNYAISSEQLLSLSEFCQSIQFVAGFTSLKSSL
jgi:hypothetical protein